MSQSQEFIKGVLQIHRMCSETRHFRTK